MFYSRQNEEDRKKYKSYLKVSGMLSRLFSNSPVPYLHYRTAENIFCSVFGAINLAIDDIAVDAKNGVTGIGIKTFLHGNGNTFQKIAEFNRLRAEFENRSPYEIALKASELRNYRLEVAEELHGLKDCIYHCVTREAGKLNIYEEKMEFIDTGCIKNIQKNKNTVFFNDGRNEYSFSLSKHTIFKRFSVNKILDTADIEIIENPFEALSACFGLSGSYIAETYETKKEKAKSETFTIKKYVYLPLYAPSDSEMRPAQKSGLNQWNAGGRARHPDEVYIPVPAWIHRRFTDFFPENNDIYFKLHLPNGKTLIASMCQQGRKGLMSNPNKALGKWLLRDVLKLPEGELVTRKILDEAGIDSVRIEKIGEREYKIDFASTGAYEKFRKRFGE